MPYKSATPEHDKRMTEKGHIHPDVLKSYWYVDSVLWTADAVAHGYAWHGWALREAFLAGMSAAREESECESP